MPDEIEKLIADKTRHALLEKPVMIEQLVAVVEAANPF